MNGSWTVGLSLIVLTIALHTVAVVVMASVIARIRVAADKRDQGSPLRPFPIVIGVIGGVGLLLAMLYGVEALLWALAYVRLSVLDTLAEAFLYSMGTMTTLDIPGLSVPPQWQMMSALEAVDGVLLFGISTAFLFTAMQQLWPMLSHRQRAGAS